MSTVKANAYLDSSGGTTATINGITPISSAALTTTAILSATAGATAQAVGTYTFAATVLAGGVAAGTTVAGSNLRLSDSRDTVGAALSGTWLNMGGTIAQGAAATLFLRVS